MVPQRSLNLITNVIWCLKVGYWKQHWSTKWSSGEGYTFLFTCIICWWLWKVHNMHVARWRCNDYVFHVCRHLKADMPRVVYYHYRPTYINMCTSTTNFCQLFQFWGFGWIPYSSNEHWIEFWINPPPPNLFGLILLFNNM